MMIDLKRYFFKLLIFSAILFLLSIAFAILADGSLISKAYFFFIPYFLLVGMFSRYLLSIASKRNGMHFSMMYTAISMGRLLLSIFILIGYSLIFREDAYPFMIGFFIFYLLYTSYEVYLLFHSVKK